jgi:hypothetical protein
LAGSRWATWLGAAALAWAGGTAPAQALWQSTPIARLRLESRYDDDLVGKGGGAAGIVAPSLGWRLRKPTVDLQAIYGIDVYAYARLVPDAGGENHRLQANETVELDRRTRLSLRQAGESVYDPTALTRPGVVRTGGGVVFAEGDADLAHRLTPRLHGSLGFHAERSWFTDAAALDGTTVAPRAAAGLALSPRDELTGRYRFQLFSFDRAPSWSSHEPMLGLSHLLAPAVRLTLEGGAALLRGPDGRAPTEPIGRAELSWRWPRFTLAAGGERTLVGAAGLADPLRATFASLHASYRLSEPLTATAAVAAFHNDRPGGAFVANGFTAEAGAEYALGEGFAARFAVRRVAQRGGVDVGVDLSRNIYAAGLTWRFDGPPPR